MDTAEELLSYAVWKARGYQVARGSKCKGWDGEVPLFDKTQVSLKRSHDPRYYDASYWELDEYMDMDGHF